MSDEIILSRAEQSRAEQSRAEQSKAERNDYIDFLRGVAAIGIVAIHTAFWGGQSYTPEWFWNLTLFLDVPFFFFLSGWASSYRKADIRKTGKSLIGIWMKWVFFISLLAIFCMVSTYLPIQFQGVSNARDLINNYMFNVSFPGFCVVGGSIWFMPYYFVVLLVNSVVITFIEHNDEVHEYKLGDAKKTYLWLLLGAFVWVCYGKYSFGLDLIYFLFYSFFWMLGLCRFVRIKNISNLIITMVICVVGIVFTSYLQGLPLYDLQNAKFSPSLKYGIASMFAIIIANYLDGKIKKFPKGLVHIGRNAIWYYFGQGIGSSLNYYIVNIIKMENWIIKWSITFFANIIMTVIIAEFLAVAYKRFCEMTVLIKKRYVSKSSL